MAKKLKTIGVRVDEELFSILEWYAEEEDRTISYLARKAIEKWVKDNKLDEKFAKAKGNK